MDEKAELGGMTTDELVAYRNIMLMSARCFQVTDDPTRLQRHMGIVEGILTERGVTFEPGKTLRKAG